jgi:hypothetical protein
MKGSNDCIKGTSDGIGSQGGISRGTQDCIEQGTSDCIDNDTQGG